MWNAIPVLDWMISLGVSISLSVPFWFIWNRLAPVYFYWLPAVYQRIPFWNCVGLFIIVSILRTMVPTLVSSSSSSK